MLVLLADSLIVVATAAERIAAYGASIREAHQLGHGPGTINELWTHEYQEKAMQVYTQTIPWPYLTNLADQFKAAAREMTVAAAPGGIGHEWFIVTEYLRAASDVILALAPPSEGHRTTILASSTPSVMQFGLLAEIASVAGAEELHAAGSTVRLAMRIGAPNASNSQAVVRVETEGTQPIELLSAHESTLVRRLISGGKVADIAIDLGYSERTLYRQLKSIWKRVGAKSRSAGIAKIVAEGWLR